MTKKRRTRGEAESKEKQEGEQGGSGEARRRTREEAIHTHHTHHTPHTLTPRRQDRTPLELPGHEQHDGHNDAGQADGVEQGMAFPHYVCN